MKSLWVTLTPPKRTDKVTVTESAVGKKNKNMHVRKRHIKRLTIKVPLFPRAMVYSLLL